MNALCITPGSFLCCARGGSRAHCLSRRDERLERPEGAVETRFQLIVETLKCVEQRLKNSANVNVADLSENRFIRSLQRSNQHRAGIQCVNQTHDLLVRCIDRVEQTLQFRQQAILQCDDVRIRGIQRRQQSRRVERVDFRLHGIQNWLQVRLHPMKKIAESGINKRLEAIESGHDFLQHGSRIQKVIQEISNRS